VGYSWVSVGSYLGPSLALAPPAKPYSRHPPSRKPPSKNSPLRGDPTKWIWVEFRCNLFEAGRLRGTVDQASKQQIFKHKNVETWSGPTLGLRARVWFCKPSLLIFWCLRHKRASSKSTPCWQGPPEPPSFKVWQPFRELPRVQCGRSFTNAMVHPKTRQF
jgi:hypothetical protein